MGEEFGIGATAVGLRTSNAVVLAAERRVSYGFYTLSKSGRKVFLLDDKLGIATAGVIADSQILSKVIKYQIDHYRLDTGVTPSVRSIAKYLSLIMFNRRFMPFISEVIIGGLDRDGSHIIVLDPLGSLIEDNYVALGTGAKLAISVLENEYREDMPTEEARMLAIKAVKTAIERDPVSGDGIDVLIISEDKTREENLTIRKIF